MKHLRFEESNAEASRNMRFEDAGFNNGNERIRQTLSVTHGPYDMMHFLINSPRNILLYIHKLEVVSCLTNHTTIAEHPQKSAT